MKGNGQYKIERGIQPPTVRARDPARRNALRKMKPGDSMFIPSSDGDRASIAADVSQIFGRGKGASRKVEGGTRVWRLK